MSRLHICEQSPVSADQIRTVLSFDPDATNLESGEMATEFTVVLWPSIVCRPLLQCDVT